MMRISEALWPSAGGSLGEVTDHPVHCHRSDSTGRAGCWETTDMVKSYHLVLPVSSALCALNSAEYF